MRSTPSIHGNYCPFTFLAPAERFPVEVGGRLSRNPGLLIGGGALPRASITYSGAAMIPSLRSSLGRLFCCTVMLGTLSGCEPGPTETSRWSADRRPSAVAPSSPSLAYATIGTYSIGGVNASGSTTDRSTQGPTLPNKKLLYRVTASGTVTATRTAYWNNGPTTPAEGAYGPSGYANGSPTGTACYAFIYIGSTSTFGGETWYAPSCLGGASPLPNSASGHVYLAGATTINRASSTGGGQWDCSAPTIGYGPCFHWADDGQFVTIERVEAAFSLTASPTFANYNDVIAVTASISPSGPLDGREIPWTIDSTKWVPAFGQQQNPCSWADFLPQNSGPTRTCQKAFKRGGTLSVWATVNGQAQFGSVTIVIPRSRVSVTAVPSALTPNNSATFTASVAPTGPPWSISSWRWQPDSGSLGQGIGGGGCGWNKNPCTKPITRSGTMTVLVSIDGVPDSASVRVNCLPCVTGDSLLDDARLRRLLSSVLAASNPNAAPDQRKERIGVRLRRPDGSIVDSLLPPLPGASPCRSWGVGQWDPGSLNSVGTIVVFIHSHPFKPGPVTTDTLPNSCRNPSLPANLPQAAAPGPSPADAGMPGPQLIIDKDNVYYLPSGVSSTWVTRKRSQCDLAATY
ncbi:MAG: hypothetical protein ILNGONEN_00949 [Syntrophorhabdaceae bacterium]|nr:hypothetical protein [Syntrophorhabdaceae bacterium]